jgi:hypothetical protein
VPRRIPHEYRTDAAERARSTVLLQVRAAQRLIEAARPPSETDVHEARKAIKRARATWRLLRFCMPPRTLVATNRALRDAGRALGRARCEGARRHAREPRRVCVSQNCRRIACTPEVVACIMRLACDPARILTPCTERSSSPVS